MKLSKREITTFQKFILDWYAINKRDFPWRQTRDAYTILISEVMSQQTQITRVVPKFTEWMKKFPTVEHLANTTVSEVLQYWSGLGYNRRALHLKNTAEKIVKEYDGIFPDNEKELLGLPGIGEYTSRAILCFAFDKQVAVVDTNVRKIIVTQFGFDGDTKKLQQIAEQLLPEGNAYIWNQALMDYAAVMLKKEKIQIPKQSTFIGSHRYYRGQVLKILLKNKQVSFTQLGLLLKEDYSEGEERWLKKLLQELETEGFIVKKNNKFILA